MTFPAKYREYLPLTFLLILAATMRFYHYASWSLSNDELSVIFRVSYDSFAEIISKGIATEGHPAGYHFFVWGWIQLFGDSTAMLRLPFALAGTAAIGFMYFIGCRWFSKEAALTTSGLAAVLEFPIMYSQLARPYSLGLFAVMGMVWCWTLIIQQEKPKRLVWIGFILFGALCTYLHYFAFFLAVLVGLAGLFMLSGKKRIHYLIASGIIGVLFLPHLQLFITQSQIGGLSEWLSRPTKNWLPEHIFYIFNESTLLLIGVLALSAFFWFQNFKNTGWTRYHSLCLLFFLTPFLVAFFYSRWKAPLLQNSTLYFSFPFLLLFLFATIREQGKLTYILPGLLILLGVYSTAFEQAHYQTHHFGVFEELVEERLSWDDEYGAENITTVVNLNNPYYFNHYLTQAGLPEEEFAYDAIIHEQLPEFYRFVQNCSTSYFAFAWSSRVAPYEIEELIQTRYPVLVDYLSFFNSGIYLYGQSGTPSQVNPEYSSRVDFEQANSNQGYQLDSIQPIAGNYSGVLTEAMEFSPVIELPITEFGLNNLEDYLLKARVDAKMPEGAKAHLVIQIHREGEDIVWHGIKLEEFKTSPGDTNTMALMFKPFPKEAIDTDKVKVYVWKNSSVPITIDNLSLEVFDIPLTRRQKKTSQ